MTDHDRTAVRREIADALLKALERRHEVADVVVESKNKAAAVEAIVTLLDTSHVAAEAVMGMSFNLFTIDSRKKILGELEDLNKQLSFTLGERPASSVRSWIFGPSPPTGPRPLHDAHRRNRRGRRWIPRSGGQHRREIRAALNRVV